MEFGLTVGQWREGEALAGEGSVKRCVSYPLQQGQSAFRASVTGRFGFVHHPAILMEENLQTMTGYLCDCQRDGDGPCLHCIALACQIGARADVRIRPGEAARQRLLDTVKDSSPSGTRQRSDLPVVILQDRILATGEREVQGKVKCDFGFLHRPTLHLAEGRVKDCACDCYEMSSGSRLCSHCKALLEQVAADRNTL